MDKEKWMRAGVCVVSGGTAAALLLVLMGGTSRVRKCGEIPDIRGRFESYTNDRVGQALEGVLTVEKKYWLDESLLIAPVPCKEGFGVAQSPAEMKPVLKRAGKLLEGEKLVFSEKTELFPGSEIQYYLDDTIFCMTWKQLMDGCCYTFSETRIAHPSQFRRFLAGGTYGAEALYVTTDMAKTVNAVLASSGDFYSYRRAGTIVYGGKVQRVTNGLVDTCYIDRQGDLHFTRASEQMNPEEAQQFVDEKDISFSLAFGPVLVQDGKQVETWSYAVGEIDGQFPRSALCQMGKLHYLTVTANHEHPYYNVPRLEQFRKRVAETGCSQAYTLDGGQTAVIALGGEMVNLVMFGVQRKISDIFYFATAIPNGGTSDG